MAQAAIECTQSAICSFMDYGYNSKCTFVQENCSGQTSIIDFFNFYYCNLNENNFLFLIFAIFFILFAFYCISATAEENLEPALSTIAEKLNLSESLAGVTLVALANGAPDVFAAFATGSLQDEGIFVPLGGLLGAGIFAITFILAICLLFSKKTTIQAEKWSFTRDCLFYLASLVYLLGLGLYGEINIFGVMGFFALYCIFIGLAFYREIQLNKKGNQNKELYYDNEVLSMMQEEYEDELNLGEFVQDEYIRIESPGINSDHGKGVNSNKNSPRNSENSQDKLSKYSSHSSRSKLQWQYYMMKKKLRAELNEVNSKSLFGRFFMLVSFVQKNIADFTIPATTKERWNKSKAMVQPFTMSLFFLWQFGQLTALNNQFNILIFITTTSILSLLIWKLTHHSIKPEGTLGSILLLFSFISSALWINLLAHSIVDFISLLSIFTGLPFNYLGLTLLAWGNSLPDTYVDLALVKKGLDQTALSGIFGGQFFNFAIGFGVSLIRQVLTYGTRPFALFGDSKASTINFVLIGWLIVVLAGIFIYGNKNKNVFHRNFALYLLIIYVLFLITATFLSV